MYRLIVGGVVLALRSCCSGNDGKSCCINRNIMFEMRRKAGECCSCSDCRDQS